VQLNLSGVVSAGDVWQFVAAGAIIGAFAEGAVGAFILPFAPGAGAGTWAATTAAHIIAYGLLGGATGAVGGAVLAGINDLGNEYLHSETGLKILAFLFKGFAPAFSAGAGSGLFGYGVTALVTRLSTKGFNPVIWGLGVALIPAIGSLTTLIFPHKETTGGPTQQKVDPTTL
jgi:hypothetical protein